MNINSNEPLFYPYSVLVNKCSGSCNSIKKIWILSKLSKTNETRYFSWHELHVNVDYSVGITIIADVNVMNWLIKVSVMMGLSGILARVNMEVMWIVNAEKGWLIGYLMEMRWFIMQLCMIMKGYADTVEGT